MVRFLQQSSLNFLEGHNESDDGRQEFPLFCKTTMVRPSFGSHTVPRVGEGGGRKFKAEKEKLSPQESRANHRAQAVGRCFGHEKPWIAAKVEGMEDVSIGRRICRYYRVSVYCVTEKDVRNRERTPSWH